MNALNILLIDETADRFLEKMLVAKGHLVADMTMPVASIAPLAKNSKADVLIFNIDSPIKYLGYIDGLNRDHPLPIIIFATDDTPDTINQVIKAGVGAYIVNGLEAERIDSIINIAIARFRERQQLKTELEKTKAKLEERKLIDRAKGILIKTRGYSEDEAYHTLRKLAMDRNIVIGEMAKNVIAMAELLK